MTPETPSADAITVVLVTYNSRRVLPEVLASLAGLPRLIVVDNASNDGSAALVRELRPDAEVIDAGGNLGFGRANNLALERTTTAFALLINPDCVLQPGAVDALLAATVRHPEAAIWGPKLYDAPGVLGLCYRPAFYAPQPRTLVDPDGDLCTDFLTGAAMLLNLRLMRPVGFFDPWFFLYFEDDDLCLRARRAGHPLLLINDAQVVHRVKQSSAPSWRLAYRRALCMTLSKFYIQRKYFGGASSAAMVLRVGLGSLLGLPFHALSFSRERVVRQAGRLVAAVIAPWRLRAAHCLPGSD